MATHLICHVEIPAVDLATASAFYAEVFAWEMQADAESNSRMFAPPHGPGGAFVRAGEANRATVGEILIYISTDDIDATLATAEAMGAKTLTPKTEMPHNGWFAVFRDPAGNRIGLYTEPAHD